MALPIRFLREEKKKVKTIPEVIEQATSVSTPLIAIATADPQATQDAISKRLTKQFGLISWDIARGVIALNDKGKKAAASLGRDPSEITTPGEALVLASKLPADTLVFFHMAHQYLENEQVKQATWNLRDIFKANSRCLILLGPSFILPAELAQDILLLDEPLPTENELSAIVTAQYENARQTSDPPLTKETFPDPEGKDLERIVDACRGLAAYPSEQAIAMALRKIGIDLGDLWIRKKTFINQIRALRVEESALTFADVGGLETIKDYFGSIAQGPLSPIVWLWIDEIEKLFAGAGSFGDTSGVSQDQLATFLTLFQLYGWTGTLAVGHPGTGKSLIAKTAARTYSGVCVAFDTGAAKGSLVGESEKYIRQAFKAVYAIGGNRVHCVATCNGLDSLKPEMRRRFGTPWVFDLPTKQERDTIWPISLKRYKLDDGQPRPQDEGWTGAEINKCCELAFMLQKPLTEAACYIIPIVKSDPEAIKKLRDQAAGRWLSASYPGPYRIETEEAATKGRKIKL